MTSRVTRLLPGLVVALDALPAPLREWLCFDVWTDDPIWSGLHSHEDTNDGRSYRSIWHCHYSDHDRPVIVLPEDDEPWGIVHEIGHVAHWQLGWQPIVPPLTEYALANDHEAYAEMFTAAVGLEGYAVPWLQESLRRVGGPALLGLPT